MPGDAGASGTAREGEAAAETDHAEHLARALRGHFRLRALSRAQRHRDPEILPQYLEERAARTLPRPAGAAGEELEVLDERHHRARALAEIHGGVSGHRPAHLDGGGTVVRGAGGP